MSPVFDLNAEEATVFGDVEDGTYDAILAEVEGPETGPNSNYFILYYELQGEGVQGRKVRQIAPFTGKGAGIMLDVINKITGSDLKPGDTIAGLDTDDLINGQCRVIVRNEEYEGEARPQVRRVLTPA